MRFGFCTYWIGFGKLFYAGQVGRDVPIADQGFCKLPLCFEPIRHLSSRLTTCIIATDRHVWLLRDGKDKLRLQVPESYSKSLQGKNILDVACSEQHVMVLYGNRAMVHMAMRAYTILKRGHYTDICLLVTHQE